MAVQVAYVYITWHLPRQVTKWVGSLISANREPLAVKKLSNSKKEEKQVLCGSSSLQAKNGQENVSSI